MLRSAQHDILRFLRKSSKLKFLRKQFYFLCGANGKIAFLGKVAERFNAAVLKTVVARMGHREFESHPFRCQRFALAEHPGRCRSGRTEPPAKRLSA